jgi:hypothetical protein
MAGPYSRDEGVDAGHAVFAADCSGYIDAQRYGVCLVLPVLPVPRSGAMPVTWLQVLRDLQRDWARSETYAATLEVVKRHAGAYGMGVVYAQSMISADAAG